MKTKKLLLAKNGKRREEKEIHAFILSMTMQSIKPFATVISTILNQMEVVPKMQEGITKGTGSGVQPSVSGNLRSNHPQINPLPLKVNKVSVYNTFITRHPHGTLSTNKASIFRKRIIWTTFSCDK